MRARINAFIVCIDKQSFFYQTVQPAKSSVRFDFHLFSLLQQLCAGELVAHHFKKCIPVGIVFVHVLEDAGVYKCTPEGREAFMRFIETL